MLPTLMLASLAGAIGATAKAPVSDSIFTDIRRFTQYAGAAYAEDCPSLPYGSTVLNTFNSTTTDTKAILFKDDSAEQIILAFRGSATPRNLDQDFQFGLTPLNLTGTSCPSCNVHSGFQYAYASVQDDISSAVKTAMASNPDSTLVLTGHSLGGGLAALAASSLEGQGEMPIVYSFGEPRNGDAAWAKYMTEKVPNYFRVTHYNDGVPLIPPVLLGFQHHGTELWQSLPDGNTASSTYSCEGSEPTECIASQDFGDTPVNGAHIQYTNQLIAPVLFNPACGYVEP